MQIIIFTNSNGNVSVCVPTGELPIEEVLAKDCPKDAIIVDDSILPKGDDAAFFDAWVLNGQTVSVDLTKAQSFATANINLVAKAEAQHRITNASIGLTNVLSDADWIALLTSARTAISAAKTTSDLIAAIKPVSDAIEANK